VTVTLTTDFGLRDGYVAAMKGAMLRVEPGLRLVDVTHEVPAGDVMAAAFVLGQAAEHFPAGTVHLAVVDPGVGTDRRPLAAEVRLGGVGHRFVGPDNGVLPLLLRGAGPEEAVVLDRPEAWGRARPSATFHGRDVFGPVAARLAAGAALGAVGSPVGRLAPMHWPLPRADAEGIDGMVVHVDRFGNCVTNIPRETFEGHGGGRRFKCYVGAGVFQRHAPSYGHVPSGEPLTLFGSSGHLEVAVNGGDAAALFSVERGASVTLVFEPGARVADRRRASAAGV
jgi:S-adenosylmethionine hydrolase